MKGSMRVSYPCDTWLILIITSYPIALQRYGLREAGENAHASLLITGTIIIWHVSECVPDVLSIYISLRRWRNTPTQRLI